MLKILALTLLLVLQGCGLLSEHALNQQFTENKPSIVQLLQMQQQDSKVIRIARLSPDLTLTGGPRKDIGFSEQRWNEYRDLFSKADIPDGIQVDGKYVFYWVSSGGLAIGGASRGFVHSLDAPTPLVRGFDDCPQKGGVCFIAIENNCYLFQWAT